MRVTTIKQYENEYYVSFGYNGAQFGEQEPEIEKSTNRTAHWMAHDEFIRDTNRYASIPTPKYDECKFETVWTSYTESDGKYRVYTMKVKVTWQYAK